jgi:hypothetical protein
VISAGRRSADLARAACVLGLLCGLGLTGCGTAPARRAGIHVTPVLCLDVSLPLHGAHAPAGVALLRGLRTVVPGRGVRIGASRLRLCRIFDDSGGVGADIAAARIAAEDPRTVAMFGGLTAGQAVRDDAVLAAAGIALIAPSGPAPASSSTSTVSAAEPASSTGGASPLTPAAADAAGTILWLLPPQRTQMAAVSAMSRARGCGFHRRARLSCIILGSREVPLCTGIAAADPPSPARLCVLAGPALLSWPSPADAYGDVAGRLVRAALAGMAEAGGTLTRRAAVLNQLRRGVARGTPIGDVRFNRSGVTASDLFTAYTVSAQGRLGLLASFRAH